MNKKSIWFFTLFSLILVLSVYYITMPSELLNAPTIKEEPKEEITEASILVALRVDDEEEYEEELETIKEVLTAKESTTEEKNNAFVQGVDKIYKQFLSTLSEIGVKTNRSSW